VNAGASNAIVSMVAVTRCKDLSYSAAGGPPFSLANQQLQQQHRMAEAAARAPHHQAAAASGAGQGAGGGGAALSQSADHHAGSAVGAAGLLGGRVLAPAPAPQSAPKRYRWHHMQRLQTTANHVLFFVLDEQCHATLAIVVRQDVCDTVTS
jgi:hypothetical protein